MRRLITAFAPSLIIILTHINVSAQDEALSKEITIWYQEERFILADKNDDALLDKSEVEQFKSEFAYFLEPRNYEVSDKNQDGFLSFQEVVNRTKSETIYSYQQERKEILRLAREYPLIFQADVKYLKNNPELTGQLFRNFVWMYEHSDLVRDICKDKGWMTKNPKVTLTLHKNLRWMASNPTLAKSLYKNRDLTHKLPHLLGWRANHLEFIRRHPVADKFYEMEFIPEGVLIK